MTIAQRVAQVSANYENATRVREFVSFAKYLLDAKGMPATAWENAKRANASPRVLSILKSAVGAGGADDPVWAGALSEFSTLAQAFLSSLAPWSAYDTVLNDGAFFRVPLRTRVSVVTTAASGAVVGEGQPKPVSKLALTNQELLVRKVVSIVALNQEVVRSVDPAALDLINNELRKAVASKSDETFLDILVNTTGIASAASTGMSAAQFAADLSGALDSISYGSNARLYLVLSPAAAKVVAFMRDANGTLYPDMSVTGNGTIAGIKVIVSGSASDAILFDASQIAANSDTIVIDASSQASVVLDDAPSSGPQGMTSLWQSNMQALRATRYFGVEVLRPEAVAVITGTTS
jgi:HK97 family phage major capsid protein